MIARVNAPIKPILKYPGSKALLAPQIVARFPKHLHYLEPFFGSGAVFFSKPPSTHEVINDVNASIVNLFRVLRTQGEALAEQIALTPWAEQEYLAIEDDCTDPDPLEHARKFLVRCWMAHGNNINQRASWRHNGRTGDTYPVRLWQQLPARLVATIERLKDAEIMCRPALEVIGYFKDEADALFYLDPPYPLDVRSRRYYHAEMSLDDHRALLEALEACQGYVFLSGYAHPLYDERLAHWQRIEFASVAEHGRARTEVLWINPKAAATRQLSLFD